MLSQNCGLPSEFSECQAMPLQELLSQGHFAYVHSLEYFQLSDKLTFLRTRENVRNPLLAYSALEFSPEVYAKLADSARQRIEDRSTAFCEALHNGVAEYHLRTAFVLNEPDLPSESFQVQLALETLYDSVDNYSSKNWVLDTLKGNNEEMWPQGLAELRKALEAVKIDQLYCEYTAERLAKYFRKALQSKDDPQLLTQILAVILLVSFKSGRYEALQDLAGFLVKLDKEVPTKVNGPTALSLWPVVQGLLGKGAERAQERTLTGCMTELANAECFLVCKNMHFSKNSYEQSSVTTDGKYLYIIRANVNGGMFKVGTGQGGTRLGHLYLERPSQRVEEVSWVFLKEKLYLRYSTKEVGSIEVISPETLQSEGFIQLYCPLLNFPSGQNYNKNCPLLTDGQYLYIVGKAVKNDRVVRIEKDRPCPPPRIKGPKKAEPESQVKLLQFILHQYDVNSLLHGDDLEEGNDDLAAELCSSFAGFFSLNECRRALSFKRGDIASAAQWLAEEGEKERCKRAIAIRRTVVLAQAEVSGEIGNQKSMRNSSNEILTKQGAVLNSPMVHDCVWTIDSDNVYCYAEEGIKVFSKQEADFRHLDRPDQTCPLMGTFKTVLPYARPDLQLGKLSKGSRIHVAHDPVRKVYYIVENRFQFPTFVLVYKDVSTYPAWVDSLTSGLAPSKEIDSLASLARETMRQLIRFQRHRFSLIAGLNSTRLLLELAATQLQGKDQENPQQRKKLKLRKSKLQSKIGKFKDPLVEQCLAGGKQPFLMQFKRNSLWCQTGSLSSLEFIYSLWGTASLDEFVPSLRIWVNHAEKVQRAPQRYEAIGLNLLDYCTQHPGPAADSLLSVLVLGFFVFYKSAQAQQRFLSHLFVQDGRGRGSLREFVSRHVQNWSLKEALEWPCQSICFNVDRKECEQDCKNIARMAQVENNTKAVNITHRGQSFPTGLLLIESRDQLYTLLGPGILRVAHDSGAFLEQLGALLADPQPHHVQLCIHLLFRCFRSLSSQKLKLSDCNVEYRLLVELMASFADLLLERLGKTDKARAGALYPLVQALAKVFVGSNVCLGAPVSLLSKLVSLASALIKVEGKSVLEKLSLGFLEGIDQTAEQVFQTPHPYQRGRQIPQETFSFPGAIAVVLELDKRCQSDPNNDYLNVLGESSLNNSNFQGEDLSYYSWLKISGQPLQNRAVRRFVILGSRVHIEFVSSGVARDSQSLIKWGFKVSIRPIYSVRHQVHFAPDLKEKEAERLPDIQAYATTLKLLVMGVTISVQQLFSKHEEPHEHLAPFLKLSLFHNGLSVLAGQEDLVKWQEYLVPSGGEEAQNIRHICGLDSRSQGPGRFNLAFYSRMWLLEQQPQRSESRHHPRITSFIEQIQQGQGEFYSFLQEVLESPSALKQEPSNYRMEKKRAGFVKEYQEVWRKTEGYLLLVMLHHGGLLEYDFNRNKALLKGHVNTFYEARTQMITRMIAELQVHKEWQHLLESYHEKIILEEEEDEEEKEKAPRKDVVKVTKSRQGRKTKVTVERQAQPERPRPRHDPAQREKLLREGHQRKIAEIESRLSLEDMVRKLMLLKGLHSTDNAKEDRAALIRLLASEVPGQQQSPYLKVAQAVTERCLFLLELSPPVGQAPSEPERDNESIETEHEVELKPPGLSRCLSHQTGEKNIDKGKVEMFREWIESWKKWKRVQDPQLEGNESSLVSKVVYFLNCEQAPLAALRAAIREQHLRCRNRVVCLTVLNQLLKAVSNTCFDLFVLTSLRAQSPSLEKGIECAGAAGRRLIECALREKNEITSSICLNKTKKIITITFQNLVEKRDLPLKAQLRHLVVLLSQLNSKTLGAALALQLVNIGLFLQSFCYIGLNLQEVVMLNRELLNRLWVVLEHVSLDQLLPLAWKEIGRELRLLQRSGDLTFIHRMGWLLTLVERAVRASDPDAEGARALASFCFYLIYHSDTPSLAKQAFKILRLLDDKYQLDQLESPFEYEYFSRKEQEKVPFRLEVPDPQPDVAALLLEKLGRLAVGRPHNSIFEQLLREELKEERPKQRERVVLSLNCEEDLLWLVKVFYYWGELTEKEKSPSSFQEYQERVRQEKEKDHGPPPDSEAPWEFEEEFRRDFHRFVQGSGEEMPVGYELSYSEFYEAQRVLRKKGGRGSKKSIKKNWNNPNFGKFTKRIEELYKTVEEPQDVDSEDNRQLIKAKIFLLKVKKIAFDVQLIYMAFNATGIKLIDKLPLEDALRLCALIRLGKQGKLANLAPDVKPELRAKLALSIPNPPKSELEALVVGPGFYPVYEAQHQAISESQPSQHSFSVYQELNQSSWIKPVLTGQSVDLLISEIVAFFRAKGLRTKVPLVVPSSGEHSFHSYLALGAAIVQSRWVQLVRQSSVVRMKHLKPEEDEQLYVLQGGYGSGLKQAVLLGGNDHHLNHQKVQVQNLVISERGKESAIRDFDPGQLVNLLETLLKEEPLSQQNLLRKLYLKCSLQGVYFLRWEELIAQGKISSEQLNRVISLLQQVSELAESNRNWEVYELDFFQCWIRTIEKGQQALQGISFPKDLDQYQEQLAQFVVPGQAVKKESKAAGEPSQEGWNVHPGNSRYIGALPQEYEQVSENKLLEYWEKNILPKIYEFVKTTLKPIEIEDFFEQMRIPLRKHNQEEAARVAYFICDNKMPHGAVLPDASHDWTTLSFEEVALGQWALLKLRNQVTPYFTHLTDKELQLALVQVIALDARSNSALVLHHNSEMGQMCMAWVPVSFLKVPEAPVAPHSNCFNLQTILARFGRVYLDSVSHLARQSLLRLSTSLVGFSTTQVEKVDLIKLISFSVVSHFSKNPIDGFLQNRKEWAFERFLRQLARTGSPEIEQLVKQTKAWWEESVKYITAESREVGLSKEGVNPLAGSRSQSGLVLSFMRGSELSPCSGVRFFSDPLGINLIAHSYSGKEKVQLHDPLLFSSSEVYFSFYINKDNLPLHAQNSAPPPLKALVSGIDSSWTCATFLTEALSNILYQQRKPELLLRLFLHTVEAFASLKDPLACRQLLVKLLIRLANRIRSLPGQEAAFAKILEQNSQLLLESVKLLVALKSEEEKEVLPLFNSLVQDLFQMLAVCIPTGSPLLGLLPPGVQDKVVSIRHVEALSRIINEGTLTPDVQSLLRSSLSIDSQWDNLILIKETPKNKEAVREAMLVAATEKKGRVLLPSLDVYCDKGCVLLLDGWVLEEETPEDQPQQEEEQKAPEPEEELDWECSACTLKNPSNLQNCEVCGAVRPAPPKGEISFQNVEQTDLKKVEQKTQQELSRKLRELAQKIGAEFTRIEGSKCEVLVGKAALPYLKQFLAYRIVRKEKSKDLEKVIDKCREAASTQDKAILDEVAKASSWEEISNPLQFWQILQGQGYDLWAQPATFGPNERIVFPTKLRLFQELKGMVSSQLCKDSKTVLGFSAVSLRVLTDYNALRAAEPNLPINYLKAGEDAFLHKFRSLLATPMRQLRAMWALTKWWNEHLTNCLMFVNMDLGRADTARVGDVIASLRGLIFHQIKIEIWLVIMQRTSFRRDHPPKVILERLKVSEMAESDHMPLVLTSSKEKDRFLFTIAMEQLQQVPTSLLRPIKPRGTDPFFTFEVTFKGENVMGEAGPYRQFYADISAEIQPGPDRKTRNLGILIPSPNNVSKYGEGQDRFLPNPAARSSYQLQLFEFLGLLMACSIRTSSHFTLDLPRLFWKLIVGERAGIEELEEIDKRCADLLRIVEGCPSKEVFDQEIGQSLYFTTTLSDGSTAQLKKGGSKIKVTYHGRQEYVRKVLETRLAQFSLQVKHLREGLTRLVPSPWLNLVTGSDLELTVCGNPTVNLPLLRKHTKYSGGLDERSPRIVFFWDVLAEITKKEQLKFIKFCWGQERLPATSEEYERYNVRFMIKPAVYSAANPDLALPKADTCFFNLELPAYTTKDALRNRLLLAIHTDSDSMNAEDVNIYDPNNQMAYGQEQ